MRIITYCAIWLLTISQLFGDSLSLDSAVTQFLNHNDDLKIATQEAKKANADLMTAKLRPNPVLSGGYSFLDVGHNLRDVSPATGAQATVHVDYTIELGSKRDHRIKTADANIVYVQELLKETKREQLASLADNYYQVEADELNLKNAILNRDAFTKLLATAKAKYDNGFLSKIDYQKLQLQSISYNKDVQTNTLALASDKELLAFLLGVDAKNLTLTPMEMSDTSVQPLDELINYAQKNRPDCVAARKNIVLSKEALALQKANAIPDLTVGVESESFAPQYQPLAGVSFSIPIPVFDRNQGMIERSRIDILEAATLLHRTLRQATSDVKTSYAQFEAQKEIYASMQDGLASAKNLKDKEEQIFALKAISILDLLDAQKSYRQYQQDLTQAMINLHTSLAHLKLNSGLTLTQIKGN